MEGPNIPGPKIWLDLTRKAEKKVITHISNLKDKSSWMSPFLENCKAQMAQLKAGQAGPVLVSKTPRAKINRKARRSALSPPGSKKIGSVKKLKKTRKSSKSTMLTEEVPKDPCLPNEVVVEDVPLNDTDEVSDTVGANTEILASPVETEGSVDTNEAALMNAPDEIDSGVADQSPTVVEAILSQAEVLVKEVPMNVPVFEEDDEVVTVEEIVEDIPSEEKEVSSPVDATFNVDEAADVADGTFVVQAVTESPGAEQEAQIAEECPESVEATYRVDETAANETYNMTPGLQGSKIAEDSDADAESEAFEEAPNSEGKTKSLRKTRTLSLQKKRALHVSTESDSDTATATPPANKNRKLDKSLTKTVEKVDKSLTKTVETVEKLEKALTKTVGKVATDSLSSTSAQKLPTDSLHPEAAVFTRVTRSKSQSVTESSSDSTPVPRSRSSMRRSSRGVRKSSVSASLLKVSAARGASVSELLATQEVVLVKPVPTDAAIPSPITLKSKSGPAIRTMAMGTPSSTLNNSRAPAGKIVRPGKKVFASGGRGVSPATGPRSGGMSGGSQGGVRSRSRMDIINRAGQRTPSGARTPTSGGVKSRDGSKPRGGAQLDEIQEQREMEMKKKEEKEADAKHRREELLKKKADDQREKREARIKRVQDARQKQEVKKGSKLLEKEKAEKLEALKKREEKAKAEADKKKLDAEEAARKEEERKIAEARAKVATEEKKAAEAKRKEAELLVAKEKAAQSLLAQAQLNSTYSKPGDTTANITMDTTQQGVSSYDMTPARHELPPEPSQDEENYGLDDLNSEEDTDDEDCPRKVVPKWAEGSQLRTALLKQCYMGPDLDMIFANVEMPDLSSMFAQQRKRFFKRTSSAVWETPPESFKHAARKR